MESIKYRAWDRMQRKMASAVSVYNESDGIAWWSANHVDPETGNIICSFDEKTGVLLPSSGRKDDSGAEEYKGDIVKCVDTDGSEFTGMVTMIGYAWGIETKDRFYAFSNLVGMQSENIIGNLYENLELLPWWK